MALKSNATEGKNESMKYNVKVERAHRFPDGNIAVDLTVNGVKINGAAYRTKKDNPDEGFISFPSRKGSDNKYYSWCYAPINTPILIADIEDQIDSLLS